jgi:hypothetical protein
LKDFVVNLPFTRFPPSAAVTENGYYPKKAAGKDSPNIPKDSPRDRRAFVRVFYSRCRDRLDARLEKAQRRDNFIQIVFGSID